MATASEPYLSDLAADVYSGLTATRQKKLPSKYFYDDLGSKLFEAITLLPEYGLSRADERVLHHAAASLASLVPKPINLSELGSGSGRKTASLLRALVSPGLRYFPIDVSQEALAVCNSELSGLAEIYPVHSDYLTGLRQVNRWRRSGESHLVLFCGSTIGNFERSEQRGFLREVRSQLKPGDFFLLGADLVKDVETMLLAYDDPSGVTAAFNLNLLGRLNRELDSDFDLRSFAHEVRWNAEQRRIEMHLLSRREQSVFLKRLQTTVTFHAGETIWTESSHKFTLEDLYLLARNSDFEILETWIDEEWPFAETLWRSA